MASRVELTPRALKDADGILNWLIEEHAGESGLRWFRGLKIAIGSLEFMPERCPLAPENAAVTFEMRQLLYGSKRNRYRILFTIQRDRILVLRLRRPGQQLLTRIAVFQ